MSKGLPCKNCEHNDEHANDPKSRRGTGHGEPVQYVRGGSAGAAADGQKAGRAG
jgi:hypothetical protein